MEKIKESLWSKLDDTASSILEIVDINMSDIELTIGEEFVTRFHKGIVSKKVVDDIMWYQNTEENEGYYSAEVKDNKLYIKFLKRAF